MFVLNRWKLFGNHLMTIGKYLCEKQHKQRQCNTYFSHNDLLILKRPQRTIGQIRPKLLNVGVQIENPVISKWNLYSWIIKLCFCNISKYWWVSNENGTCTNIFKKVPLFWHFHQKKKWLKFPKIVYILSEE